MEMKITGGKYTAAEYQGFETVNGIEELAQRLIMKLSARRGRFLPLPDYGSGLYLLPTVKPSQRETAVRHYVAEALSDEDEVELESAEIESNGDTMQISLTFLYNGETELNITTEI